MTSSESDAQGVETSPHTAAEQPLSPLLFREICDPAEVVGLLRLRHRIYFEECKYGPSKPLALDLTAHDMRSRFFGVFRGQVLAGGVRLVFRSEQPLAGALRALHAAAQDRPPGECGPLLPSEEAFELRQALGQRQELIDVEVGRLVVARPAVGRGATLAIAIATLAALHLARCRFYLYACAVELAPRFARVANPRWVLGHGAQAGIRADGFAFPKRSVAAVATLEDSPHLAEAIRCAEELARSGAICLQTVRFNIAEEREPCGAAR